LKNTPEAGMSVANVGVNIIKSSCNLKKICEGNANQNVVGYAGKQTRYIFRKFEKHFNFTCCPTIDYASLDRNMSLDLL